MFWGKINSKIIIKSSFWHRKRGSFSKYIMCISWASYLRWKGLFDWHGDQKPSFTQQVISSLTNVWLFHHLAIFFEVPSFCKEERWRIWNFEMLDVSQLQIFGEVLAAFSFPILWKVKWSSEKKGKKKKKKLSVSKEWIYPSNMSATKLLSVFCY